MLNVGSRIVIAEVPGPFSATSLGWIDPDLVKDHWTPKISGDGNLISHGSLTDEPGSQYVTLP